MLMVLVSSVDSPDDKRKIEVLYDMYNNLMYTVAFNILNHNQDAEDAVIEAWEKIIKNLDKINENDCPKTKSFIVIITERTAIDIYRRNKRRSERVVSLSDYEQSPYFITRDKDVDNLELYDVIKRMPKIYSEALLLYYVNGLTVSEIADLLGVKSGAVEKRISRGRNMLKKEMKQDEG